MPRRNLARQQPRPSPPPPSQRLPPSPPQLTPDVLQLRRHWKWAAFSQFYYTFHHLFATDDITIADIENDLVHSTRTVLPRIMQRLLYTITQDRKVSLDNWQTSLRRQYARRDPDANPIGPLPSDKSTRATDSLRPSEVPVRSSRASSLTGTSLPQPNEWQTCNSEIRSSRDVSGLLKVENQEIRITQSSGGATDGDSSLQNVEQANIDEYDDEAGAKEDEEEGETLVDWLNLPMMAKLESMHTVMEWHFQNPYRLRALMKDDDETAQWRIEPIGYDSKRNAYWLIGADRLWIQREPLRTNLKRKRPVKKSESASKGRTSREANDARLSKRPRVHPSSTIATASVSTPSRLARRGVEARVQVSPETPTGRSNRAAKARANQKLDAQAKDLAEYRRQVLNQSHAKTQIVGPFKSSRPTGTRISARLRGSNDDEEWQQIPKEWLNENSPIAKGSDSSLRNEIKKIKTGLESGSDDASELTDLSELSESREHGEEVAGIGQSDNKGECEEDAEAEEVRPEDVNFVEWETICVTLRDWEYVTERFAKATHHSEKALYKVLTQAIVPAITSELREIERQKRLEEAVSHRKRSARIALKESEKEEEQRKAQQRAEQEEKLSRARRLEARLKKEEEERQKKEHAREQRRREREQREENRARLTEEAAKSKKVANENGRSSPVIPVLTNSTSSKGGCGARTPTEDWELDCEVCQRRGINQDDDMPLMCCGSCSRWQHIICHDRRDTHAGHPRRDWDKEDFVCQKCRQAQLLKSTDLHPSIASTADTHAYRVAPSRLNHVPASAYPHYQVPANNSHVIPSAAAALRGSVYPSDTSAQQPPMHHNQSGVTFAHYQPQQGGFSTSRASYFVQDPNHAHAYLSQAQGPSRSTQYPPYTEKWYSTSYSRPGTSYEAPFTPQTYSQGIYPLYGDHSSHLARPPQSDIRSNGNQTMSRQYSQYDNHR